MTAKDQMIFTANALRNLAKTMESSGSYVPREWIHSLRGHATDLDAAAKDLDR